MVRISGDFCLVCQAGGGVKIPPPNLQEDLDSIEKQPIEFGEMSLENTLDTSRNDWTWEKNISMPNSVELQLR